MKEKINKFTCSRCFNRWTILPSENTTNHPKECFRLQGFPDWAFEAARKVSSNSQLYKQAGNSVTVPVIAAIAKKLKEIEEKR